MKNKLFSMITLASLLVLSITSISASALSTIADVEPTEVVLEDNRTLTPKGNAELMDDVTDNENLQFITVTARDGNVFYFVIDHGAETENVYFLNTVDEADLNALLEENISEEISQQVSLTETPTEEPEITDETDEPYSEKEQNENNMLLPILLVVAAAVGIGGYYYKIILPKKKLAEADDIEDFDFDDEDEDADAELSEDVDEADEVYGEDGSEDNEKI